MPLFGGVVFFIVAIILAYEAAVDYFTTSQGVGSAIWNFIKIILGLSVIIVLLNNWFFSL